MALTTRGKILYGIAFLLLVPLALIGWAFATSSAVGLPAVKSAPLGLAAMLTGALLLLAGMRDLWRFGGGLPMNAHPPARFVDRGAYRWLPHPIYTGFCILCLGVSIAVGSASGLWLVSPVAMLGCTALVLGYEQHDLRARFGRGTQRLLPENSHTAASVSDRAVWLLLVLLPWFAVLWVVEFLGGHTAVRTALPKSGLWTQGWLMVYISGFLGLAALGPFGGDSRGSLRRSAIRSLWAIATAFAFFLALPLLLPGAETLAGAGGWNCFPAIPVVWALLVAEGLGERNRFLRWISLAWAILVAVSCLVLSRNGWLSILGAFTCVTMADSLPALWRAVRAGAESIANSWQDWRFGPVRVINHGVYAGVGAFLAIWIDIGLAGAGNTAAIVFAAFAAVVGAALWAQFVEGSPQLLRPYGFYGGLLGGTLGALAAPLFHTSIWLVLGVFSATGALGQAAGRLRCLVQGCCHGRPAPEVIGIRYRHPNSRVCRFTAWTGVPIHPTPVYSILWNCVLTLVLIRLWSLHASLQLIAGLYFILTGLGRFVEEAWRGEPQTKVVAGLRIYQWAAVVSVLLGMLFSSFADGELAPGPSWSWGALLPAAAVGFVVFCAMGVDFPESNRRFSRLA